MDWPTCSSDVNLIENLWDLIERHVHKNKPPSLTLQQLLALLQMEWHAMPQAELRIHAMTLHGMLAKLWGQYPLDFVFVFGNIVIIWTFSEFQKPRLKICKKSVYAKIPVIFYICVGKGWSMQNLIELCWVVLELCMGFAWGDPVQLAAFNKQTNHDFFVRSVFKCYDIKTHTNLKYVWFYWKIKIKQRWLLAFKKTRLKNERFLMSTRQNNAIFW